MSRELTEILSAASIEELHQLRDIVLSAKKWSTDDRIKGDYMDPKVDGLYLAEEIRKFGGNSFVNVFRDEGPDYKEVVEDVADKIKAKYPSGSSIEDVESAIISKVLVTAWAKMTVAEREDLVADCKLSGSAWKAGGSAAALQRAFEAGGFSSYMILVVVADAVLKQATGVGLRNTGLPVATSVVLGRLAAALWGPIAWAITGLITAIQIAGPSYKVTIPSVVLIAYLRRKQAAVQCGECGAILLGTNAKFCPECGAKFPE